MQHFFYLSLPCKTLYLSSQGSFICLKLELHFSFKRPVGIAVYGHPSYEVSEYYLEVVYRQNKDIYVFEEDEEDQEGYFGQEQKIDREEGDQITEEVQFLICKQLNITYSTINFLLLRPSLTYKRPNPNFQIV